MIRAMKIDLPNLYADPDRHGNLRLYFRKAGRKVRLRAEPGSAAFLAEYRAAAEQVSQPAQPAPQSATPAAGTLGWLARLYMMSGEFRRLDAQSRRNRESVILSCLDEPLKPGSPDLMGACPLKVFGARHVKVLRDRKADRPGAANNRLKYLSSLFGWAVEDGRASANPCRDVRRIKYQSHGYYTWTQDDVARFEAHHPAGSKPRLALALLLYTGARRGDVVTLGRQHIRQGWLRFTPGKTGRRADPVSVEIPLLAGLQAEIESCPQGQLTFLLTGQGKPFTPAGFGGWFKQQCVAAGLPDCAAHGLRKAGAARAAERGATDHQLMAIYGWTNPKQAGTYTRKASRKKLAAGMAELFKTDEQ